MAGEEELEQVAGLLRLPFLEADRLAVAEYEEPSKRLDRDGLGGLERDEAEEPGRAVRVGADAERGQQSGEKRQLRSGVPGAISLVESFLPRHAAGIGLVADAGMPPGIDWKQNPGDCSGFSRTQECDRQGDVLGARQCIESVNVHDLLQVA